jgi:hypothetical protein
LLQVFEREDMPPAKQKRGGADDPKTAIDDSPRNGNAAKRTRDEGERNDSCARAKTEGDDPLVANGIVVGTEECNGDHEMRKGQPICAIREKWVLFVRHGKRIIDPRNPGKMGVFGDLRNGPV